MSHPRSGESYWTVFKDFLLTLRTLSVAFVMSVFRFIVPKSRKDVKNNIVLITGAGSGMGRYLSVEFAKLGATVVLWDINEFALSETKDVISKSIIVCECQSKTKKGCKLCDCELKIYDYVCDVSNKEEVYETSNRVKREVGDVDILINNAAIAGGSLLLETPDDNIIQTFNVNLLAHFWTVKSFLPSMLSRNHGHIVSMASSCGFAGVRKLLDYSASKYGVVGFSEVLNYEIVFAGYTGVHVTTVCPSFVETGMFQGCSMRYHYLLPDLQVQTTVDRIMAGILRNEHFVCIPGRIALIPFFKALLPHDAWVAIIRFLGADVFMDTFEGSISSKSHSKSNTSKSTVSTKS